MQLEKRFQSDQKLHELLQTLLDFSIIGIVGVADAISDTTGERISHRSEPPGVVAEQHTQ